MISLQKIRYILRDKFCRRNRYHSSCCIRNLQRYVREEKGQAIAEMTIGLIGIMVIFIGMLCVSSLGIENIKNLLTARGKADGNASAGVEANPGVSVQEWNYGEDGLLFTADDSYITGSSANPPYISDELKSTDGSFDLTTDLTDKSYVENNFAESLPETSFFVNCADLTSYTSRVIDPLGEHNLSDIKSIFSYLMGTSADITLTETVFMPKVSE